MHERAIVMCGVAKLISKGSPCHEPLGSLFSGHELDLKGVTPRTVLGIPEFLSQKRTGVSLSRHMGRGQRSLDIRDTSSFIPIVTSSLGLLCDMSSLLVTVLMVLPRVLTEGTLRQFVRVLRHWHWEVAAGLQHTRGKLPLLGVPSCPILPVYTPGS